MTKKQGLKETHKSEISLPSFKKDNFGQPQENQSFRHQTFKKTTNKNNDYFHLSVKPIPHIEVLVTFLLVKSFGR